MDMIKAGEFLVEVEAVLKERQGEYRDTANNCATTGALWADLFDAPVFTKGFLLGMILMKVSRFKYSGNRDCLIDIAGYATMLATLET